MHDDIAATEGYRRLQTLLSDRGITAGADAASIARVVVPWKREWGFDYEEHTIDDADAAVEAAHGAFPGWRRDEPRRRAALRALADAVESERETFARLITFENGKLDPAAHMEVAASVASLRLIADMEIPVEALSDASGASVTLVREPLGVVVAITPANMPLLMLVNKLATALLVGDTVVAKPSPFTPLSALLLRDAARGILPDDVFRVVVGGADIGRRLVEHPRTRMITLTGSRAAGKAVMASAAGTLKRLQLELGGNDPAIVLDDADVEAIAADIFRSAFSSSGQACVAVKRVYAPTSLLPALTEELRVRAEASRVGSPFDAEATHPALTNLAQYQRVSQLIETVERHGGEVLTGGAVETDAGLFIRPTVVTGLAAGSELVDEEQFGPVLPVIGYDDLDGVVDEVNAGPYGLGATIWSTDVSRAEQLARRLEVGMAWINRAPRPDPTIPFGGAKESGIGREGGRVGLDAFCELKLIGKAGADNG